VSSSTPPPRRRSLCFEFSEYGGFALFRLAGAAQDKAFRLVQYDQLTSTNDEALARARSGDAGSLWIVASAQTKGRGRHGRVWVSPRGNLHASLLLIDPSPSHRAAELGFAAGVAAIHALREILSEDRRLAIKWPNDILYGGAKLAGILLESASLPDDRLACVAGIGVNCGSHPGDTPYKATDLAVITGEPVAPEHVFEQLSAAMVHWLGIWAGGAGFAAIRAEWLSLAAGLGTRISVARPSQTMEGVFQTIDSQGRLILEEGSRQVAIEAGDVFLGRQAAKPPWLEEEIYPARDAAGS
jgi:BirA family transcriptional regulator, biotin operon repressor / biotin---[acetyl-CoA-carboxylase] ligase